MKTCPKCKSQLKIVKVKVQDADSPAISYQCPKCEYFDFEEKSMKKVVAEIKAKETPLRIKQKIIKLSKDRIGMYFNKDVARCLDLKAGNEIYVSVPDKNHIVLKIES
ncbi:hypothetical protein ACFLRX_09380 [Acidobacteriota bacterium]